MSKEPYCKNCRLYDGNKGECQVIILQEGEKYNLPVYPDDKCFFEREFVSSEPKFDKEGNPRSAKEESWTPNVQEVKWWVEDPKTGKKTKGDGIVKMQYPEGFFGEED